MDDQAIEAVESLPTESTQSVIDDTPATGGATAPIEDTHVADAVETDPGPIPYTRFKEVNDQLREMKAQREQEAALLQQFGYSSLEEMKQAAEAEFQRAEEERIAAYFQQQVESGEMDEDTAAMRRDLELQSRALRQQQAQVQAYLIGQQRDAALAAHPAAAQAPEMVDGLIQRGVPPAEAAKQVASLVERVSLAVKSQMVAAKPVVPPPMGSDNQASQPTVPASPREAMTKVASVSWASLFGAGKETV